jgi:hypothetical protein
MTNIHIFKISIFFIILERRVSGSSVPLDPKAKELQESNEKLTKQNNLLKLKVEILLDMLAQKTAEADFQQKDIDQMRKILISTHHHNR